MKPITIEALLQAATKQSPSIDKTDAELLLAYVLDKPRTYVYAWPEKAVSIQEANRFLDYLARRVRGEPLAYITGEKAFWSFNLLVNSDTLVPRPETELLVEAVLERVGQFEKRRVADLGTGSGAIALALAASRPQWEIDAIDISEKALCMAEKNRARLALTNVSFRQGCWCSALGENLYDVIVSNPPYLTETEWPLYAAGLAFEPKLALVSGKDGLSAIREIIQTAHVKLEKNGYLLIEHGYQQGQAVREIFTETGRFAGIITLRDLALHERVTLAQMM